MWCFVRCVDAGEVFDFASPGFFVKAFGVSLLADFDGGVDEDFDEREVYLLVDLASSVSVFGVWRDDAYEGYEACVGK